LPTVYRGLPTADPYGVVIIILPFAHGVYRGPPIAHPSGVVIIILPFAHGVYRGPPIAHPYGVVTKDLPLYDILKPINKLLKYFCCIFKNIFIFANWNCKLKESEITWQIIYKFKILIKFATY
jgi:hypothetical protein